MADLTPRARKALPDSDFAIPETRQYPIHNADHARNALARVAQFGSSAQKAQVRSAVASRYPGIDNGGKAAKKKKGRKR